MRRAPHIPQRTCVACRQARSKGELLRLVRTPQSEVRVDLTGKAAGRGAYICRTRTCAEQAIKQKKLARALGIPVGEEILENIEHALQENKNENKQSLTE